MDDESIWKAIADRLAGYADDAGEAILDATGKIRYGITPTEKHQAMVSGQVPGGVANPGPSQLPLEERRASGYFFGKQHPGLALPALLGVVNPLRSIGHGINPLADDPRERTRLQAIALDAALRGMMDAEK